MANKIQRQTQKIFAGNTTNDSLAAFGSMITGAPIYTDNIEDLQTNAYTQGWEAAIAANEAPFLEELNGVQYGFSKQLAYLFQSGMPEWDAETEYFINSFCQINGIWYKSLTDNNIGNNPSNDETNWQEVNLSNTTWGNIEGNIENQNDLIEYIDNNGKLFLNKTQITNSILEKPERIKVEINDGTFTLKAGSVVIYPNGLDEDGNKQFEYYTVPEDISIGAIGTYTGLTIVSVNTDKLGLNTTTAPFRLAGPIEPSGLLSEENYYWYDTTTNLIKYRAANSATWTGSSSFPIAAITRVNGIPTDINQVFNGIGFMGSVLWIDKDVKVLIPDGRNADGTLKNIEHSTSNLIVLNQSGGSSANKLVVLTADNIIDSFTLENVFIGGDMPTKLNLTGFQALWIDKINNIMYKASATTETPVWFKISAAIVSSTRFVYSSTNSYISSMYNRQTFEALDYNQKSEIAEWGFPSSKRINLTLGASGATYIAPDTGFVKISKTSNSGQYLGLVNNTTGILSLTYSSVSNGVPGAWIPVKKGEQFSVTYNSTGAVTSFFFVPANGSESVNLD